MTSGPVEVVQGARRPFFTPAKLAAYLDVSPRLVRKLLQHGVIPSYKFEGARRIDPADVDEYVRARREEKAA